MMFGRFGVLVVCCAVAVAGHCALEELELPAAVHLPVPYMAQPDNQTCLPTSLNMALRYMGRSDLTTDTVQALHKRTWYDRYNIPAIARDFGVYALPSWQELGWKKDDVKRSLAAGRPVIMGVDHGRSGHFVLAIGYTADDRVIINDPTRHRWDYPIGGPHSTVAWEQLNWRNGCMLSTQPFGDAVRDVSGLVLATTAPASLRPGEVGEFEVAVRNNGSQPWPYNTRLCAIDPWGTGGQWLKPKSDLFEPETWKSQSCAASVAETDPLVQPGQTHVFKFNVQAPETSKALTIHERFGLVDGSGRWFFEDYMASPGPWRIACRVVVAPDNDVKLPVKGDAIPWQTKVEAAGVQDVAKLPDGMQPPYEGAKVKLLVPGADGYNCAWVGNNEWRDYRVETWLWYRHEADTYKTGGFDRIGLFAHDNGMHAPVRKNLLEVGESLCIGYDGDDGSARFGDCFSGHLGDGVGDRVPRNQRMFVKESQWVKLAIECKGDTVKFYLGDKLVREDKVGINKKGDCGIYIHSCRPGEKNGLYFADFKVD